MSNKLSASEAIYGFCGWLVCREENTAISKHHDMVPVADLINRFCAVNKLEEPQEPDWNKNIVYPEEEIAEEEIGLIPGDVNKKEVAFMASIPGDEEAFGYAGGN